MKKLYLIITLFISSFFLFNSYVKADYPFIVNYEDNVLELINDEFFIVRDLVIDYANKNSYNYIIWLYSSKYEIFFIDSSNKVFTSIGRTWFENSTLLFDYYNINLDTKELSFLSTYRFTRPSSSISFLLDSNMDIYYNPYSLNINYKDNTYVVDSSTKLKTIYDIYLEFGGVVPDNSHQEEIEKVGNFYTVVIDKLGYLAEIIVSNYIYLSIIVIFLVIFLFKLIFRRHL